MLQERHIFTFRFQLIHRDRESGEKPRRERRFVYEPDRDDFVSPTIHAEIDHRRFTVSPTTHAETRERDRIASETKEMEKFREKKKENKTEKHDAPLSSHYATRVPIYGFF